MIFRYLTHPQVEIDPLVPVPQWGLSSVGAARLARFKNATVLRDTKLIVSSAETKALETASAISQALNICFEKRSDAGENDRSATGYLPPPEFERMADQFFAHPQESIRGWERSVDAQSRIVGAYHEIMSGHEGGDVLMVGHGGVGTLLYCHLAGQPIARIRDQPGGGGNLFAYDLSQQKIIHGWRAMEEFV